MRAYETARGEDRLNLWSLWIEVKREEHSSTSSHGETKLGFTQLTLCDINYIRSCLKEKKIATVTRKIATTKIITLIRKNIKIIQNRGASKEKEGEGGISWLRRRKEK